MCIPWDQGHSNQSDTIQPLPSHEEAPPWWEKSPITNRTCKCGAVRLGGRRCLQDTWPSLGGQGGPPAAMGSPRWVWKIESEGGPAGKWRSRELGARVVLSAEQDWKEQKSKMVGWAIHLLTLLRSWTLSGEYQSDRISNVCFIKFSLATAAAAIEEEEKSQGRDRVPLWVASIRATLMMSLYRY